MAHGTESREGASAVPSSGGSAHAGTSPQAGPLNRKDFATDQDVRWCPGCGDYAILNAVQTTFAALGLPRERVVMISGIGCASRFPYYMNTFGFHTIHGRAPAIATGVKLANPELSVWVVTGDGDALSIGGNHLIHALRRNIGLKILMFNNRIYGLTKGQASPTSLAGQKTKSTPHGAADHPFNPLALALGAGASFVARAVDVMAPHLRSVLEAAAAHPGSAFIEILQNCVIFNDGTWDHWVERSQRDEHLLMLEPGRPLVFGAGGSRALVLEGGKPVIREIASETAASLPPWDPADEDGSAANTLARLEEREGFPMALGILRAVRRPAYEDVVHGQLEDVARRKGPGDLARLLAGSEPWSR